MRNHPLYKQLKQIALDGEYTVEQAKNLTAVQAKNLLGGSYFATTFFENMKRGIIMTLESRDEELNFQAIKNMATSFLDTNFPDWEAERGRESNKPYVTIWLKGKP